MTLDMVWWSEYSDTLLALEHEIQERAPPALGGHRLKVADFTEQYMFVMGRPAIKFGRRAILFRRYLFDGYGNQVSSPQELTLKQADRWAASMALIR